MFKKTKIWSLLLAGLLTATFNIGCNDDESTTTTTTTTTTTNTSDVDEVKGVDYYKVGQLDLKMASNAATLIDLQKTVVFEMGAANGAKDFYVGTSTGLYKKGANGEYVVEAAIAAHITSPEAHRAVALDAGAINKVVQMDGYTAVLVGTDSIVLYKDGAKIASYENTQDGLNSRNIGDIAFVKGTGANAPLWLMVAQADMIRGLNITGATFTAGSQAGVDFVDSVFKTVGGTAIADAKLAVMGDNMIAVVAGGVHVLKQANIGAGTNNAEAIVAINANNKRIAGEASTVTNNNASAISKVFVDGTTGYICFAHTADNDAAVNGRSGGCATFDGNTTITQPAKGGFEVTGYANGKVTTKTDVRTAGDFEVVGTVTAADLKKVTDVKDEADKDVSRTKADAEALVKAVEGKIEGGLPAFTANTGMFSGMFEVGGITYLTVSGNTVDQKVVHTMMTAKTNAVKYKK